MSVLLGSFAILRYSHAATAQLEIINWNYLRPFALFTKMHVDPRHRASSKSLEINCLLCSQNNQSAAFCGSKSSLPQNVSGILGQGVFSLLSSGPRPSVIINLAEKRASAKSTVEDKQGNKKANRRLAS